MWSLWISLGLQIITSLCATLRWKPHFVLELNALHTMNGLTLSWIFASSLYPYLFFCLIICGYEWMLFSPLLQVVFFQASTAISSSRADLDNMLLHNNNAQGQVSVQLQNHSVKTQNVLEKRIM